MYHIKTDRREQKSADLLTGAAQMLLLNKEPVKLTVALLCRESGVSRTTFYRLFDEPDDVLRYASDNAFRDMIQGYVDLIRRTRELDLATPTPTRWYAEAFEKRADIIAGMVRNGKTSILMASHKKALREFASVLFPDMDPNSEEFVFFIDMRSSLLLGALNAWVETGRRASVSDMERYASRQLKYLIDEY